MNCAKPSAAPLNDPATVNAVTSFHLDPPRAIDSGLRSAALQGDGRSQYRWGVAIPAETLSSIEKLELTHAPVAVAFLDAPPPGMTHVSHAEAAGCGYWKRAAEGQAFYTTAEDH